MTFDEANACLSRITYKPGTQFYLELQVGSHQFRLAVIMPVRDALNPEQTTKVIGLVLISITELNRYSEADFIARVRQCVVDTEIHEVDEFLRFKGEYVKEPHPENARYRLEPRFEPVEIPVFGDEPPAEAALARVMAKARAEISHYFPPTFYFPAVRASRPDPPQSFLLSVLKTFFEIFGF